MKKITFILTLLISSYGFSQNVSTGVVELASDFTVRFDVNGSTNNVTMTMVGPENIWLAVALDATGMGSSGADVIFFDSTGLTDRNLSGGYSQPNNDGTQNWSSPTITTNAGVSTIVATRSLDTNDSNDYVFTTTNNTTLSLLWAKGSGFNNSSTRHANRGFASMTLSSTLGTAEIAALPEFDVYPNPADLELNVQFPASIQKAQVSVYSVLGTLVFQAELDQWNSKINTSEWSTGVFIMNISTPNFSQTKRIIKQ